MPVIDTYSWRKKRAEQVEPDVYQYDHVPNELRVQVRHILDAGLGAYVHDLYSGSKHNNRFLQELHNLLLRETGRLHLFRERIDAKSDILEAVTGGLSSVDEWLDVVEICFFAIDHVVRSWPEGARKDRGITQDPENAINELNTRFRRARFGYQFEAGRIVRVDSQYLHSEVVKPALVLLTDPRFMGAREEFLSAHAHYRAGEHEEAILNANRAFESTMKSICDMKDWQYKDGARASDLIKLIRASSLLPDYLDQSFDQLIATLKSGLPSVRNNAGGHGQGAIPRRTPGYIAAYALHLAAADIVLLVEALKASE